MSHLWGLFVSFFYSVGVIRNFENISERLYFLKNLYNNYDEAVITFNKEKSSSRKLFLKLESIYSKFKTYFIKTLNLDYSKSNGHSNVGIINLEETYYFYKELENLSFSIDDILKYYKFIENCNKIKIDTIYIYNDIYYNIHFVTIPCYIIFSISQIKDKTSICLGYLMEIIDGLTINQIKNNHSVYYKTNKVLIEHDFYNMVAKLTEQQFLLNDLHGDNLMWDMKTNTLSLIDISINSFNRESELGNNKHINFNMLL